MFARVREVVVARGVGTARTLGGDVVARRGGRVQVAGGIGG